jgi:alkylated DNA nucleotide flippase Atl1
LTAGIFLGIVARAAEEDRAVGRTGIAPYWRVVKNDGSLNEKLPGGLSAQQENLQAEGFSIIPGVGKKPPKVQDVERFLRQF